MPDRTDKELMKLVARQNYQAFRLLYQRYYILIFNFLLRYTGQRELAQDLLQETFTRVWTAAHSFDLKHGNFRGWIYSIAINLTRSEMIKKRYAYQYCEVDDIKGTRNEPVSPAREQPDKQAENADLQHQINSALSQLDPLLREVIILKHFQQLKFREIAEMTNTPEGTLKARFHRAIAKLKEIMKDADK